MFRISRSLLSTITFIHSTFRIIFRSRIEDAKMHANYILTLQVFQLFLLFRVAMIFPLSYIFVISFIKLKTVSRISESRPLHPSHLKLTNKYLFAISIFHRIARRGHFIRQTRIFIFLPEQIVAPSLSLLDLSITNNEKKPADCRFILVKIVLFFVSSNWKTNETIGRLQMQCSRSSSDEIIIPQNTTSVRSSLLSFHRFVSTIGTHPNQSERALSSLNEQTTYRSFGKRSSVTVQNRKGGASLGNFFVAQNPMLDRSKVPDRFRDGQLWDRWIEPV